MNYTDQVTSRLTKHLPRKVADLRFEKDCVRYLHPTKGWKRISYRRMGIKVTQ